MISDPDWATEEEAGSFLTEVFEKAGYETKDKIDVLVRHGRWLGARTLRARSRRRTFG